MKFASMASLTEEAGVLADIAIMGALHTRSLAFANVGLDKRLMGVWDHIILHPTSMVYLHLTPSRVNFGLFLVSLLVALVIALFCCFLFGV